MSTHDFGGLTPRQIDEEAATARRKSEDAVLNDTNLVKLTDQITEVQAQADALAKKHAKVQAELQLARAELRVLRPQQRDAIRRSLNAGVSPTRVHELTGIDRSTLSKIRKGNPPTPTVDRSN